MKAQASDDILKRTKTVIYHENNNTFSFISQSGETCRLELYKRLIKCLGGVNELKRFINHAESGKRKYLSPKKRWINYILQY
ncbi:MAG: hypothetical protein ACPLYF_02835 [Fervidobacterium sp.]